MDSVRSQTYEHWEHILVDDCSTDQSPQLIKDYAAKDERIRYIRLERNRGAGIARNIAIEAAQGRYIAFLDCDDLWHPQKLQKQIGFMQRNGHVFTYTAYDKIDEAGNRAGGMVKAKAKVTYQTALFKNPIGCLTAVYDRYFYGKEYMPEIRKRQDYALWLTLLKKADGYGMEEILASYRSTPKSISSNKLDLIKYEWKIYREIEGLSILSSLFYVCTAILIRLKNYL